MNSLVKLPSKPKLPFIPNTPEPRKPTSLFFSSISNFHQKPKIFSPNGRKSISTRTHVRRPLLNPSEAPRSSSSVVPLKKKKKKNGEMGDRQVLGLCGFGYWVQGFRCFPWLALNFHMVQYLNIQPSTLQLVQHSANLPMVAKPLYGIISDTLHIGHARRIPYISIGVLVQVLSWGTLVLIPDAGGTLPVQMACILVSNLGASFTEVASDALIAESSKNHKTGELQSYTFMALAAGAILGNLSGGFFLKRTQQPKILFLIFIVLLSFQLLNSLTTKENSLDSLEYSNQQSAQRSISGNLSKQFCELITTINDKSISGPLSWVVASVAVVPMLSGATFCYQTQSLMLDPSIIGISKVIGQFMVLSATVFYNRCLNRIPMRKLICWVQIIYAVTMLSDFFLYAFAICLLKVDHQQETALPPVGRHCFTTPENTKHPSQSWQQHFSCRIFRNQLHKHR